MYICQFCNKESSNPGGAARHSKHCKSNPNYVKGYRSPKAGPKAGSAPWNKGLRDDPRCSHSEETRLKLGNTFKGKCHTEESKQKMSEARKQMYAAGWECNAGRCLKYDYESPIAGRVKVDGMWELKFCEFADTAKLNWLRNKERFSYIRPDGKSASYQPDFYLKDFDCYIEIKGYETDLDHAKWDQFPKRLVVIRKNDMSNLDSIIEQIRNDA